MTLPLRVADQFMRNCKHDAQETLARARECSGRILFKLVFLFDLGT
jgi:hypothetical protein